MRPLPRSAFAPTRQCLRKTKPRFMTETNTKMAERIELWPLDRLVPYDRNPRTHSEEQIAQIAASIVEFGFLNPILVDTSNGIIAGHGRLQAAKKLALPVIP